MQTFRTYSSLHEVSLVARANTFVVLQQQVIWTGETVLFGWTHASFTGRMALMTMTIIIIFSCWAKEEKISKSTKAIERYINSKFVLISNFLLSIFYFRFHRIFTLLKYASGNWFPHLHVSFREVSVFCFSSSERKYGKSKNTTGTCRQTTESTALVSIFDITQADQMKSEVRILYNQQHEIFLLHVFVLL